MEASLEPAQLQSSRRRRLIAAGIDSFLSGILAYCSIALLTQSISDEIARELQSKLQTRPSEAQLFQMIIDLPILGTIVSTSVGVILIYYLAELITPCSLGKLITHIRIISADGTKSSVSQRTVRFIVKHIPFLTLLVLGLDPHNVLLIYSLLSTLTLAGVALILLPERMTLYDYVAKTKVVYLKGG